MGSEGGVIDLNFGIPETVLSAIRSESSPRPTEFLPLSPVPPSSPARRSVKEVVMNGLEKEKVGCELAEVSKLPVEEAMREIKAWEKGRERESKKKQNWLV